MAGHSKWKQIKRKKAVTDARRASSWTKVIREITVAAKSGGGDAGGNPRLRTAIDAAKAVNMPWDNIDRAIKKGTGELEGSVYEELTYEGYGPGGAAILVEALTDNRNRTGSEVRHAFDKHNGSLGEPGSVAWQFEKKGIVLVDGERYAEDDLMPAIDAGAEDVAPDGDVLKVTTAPGDLAAVRTALEEAGVEIQSAEPAMEPNAVVEVSEEAEARSLMRLMDALDEHDDVEAVHANFDIPESLLEQAAA
jgi:YebC/PmpR family DNA-binding regulatory protein